MSKCYILKSCVKNIFQAILSHFRGKFLGEKMGGTKILFFSPFHQKVLTFLGSHFFCLSNGLVS